MAIALVLALLCNRMTLLLAFGGAFLAATYPLMKRHTYLPQVYLGMAFGWAVPMAWAGQTGQFRRRWPGWCFSPRWSGP